MDDCRAVATLAQQPADLFADAALVREHEPMTGVIEERVSLGNDRLRLPLDLKKANRGRSLRAEERGLQLWLFRTRGHARHCGLFFRGVLQPVPAALERIVRQRNHPPCATEV